jgi:5'-nucleotidase
LICLLTNDDGLTAQGLQELRRQLEAMPDVQVFLVAPERERSAASHSITLHKPLQVREVSGPGERSRAWSVSGTPADCAKLAIHALLPERPQVLISGVNCGSNLGTDVFYSGTVSAAIEGTILGIPSLAVSLSDRTAQDFRLAARVAWQLARQVAERGLPPWSLLNVNVPPGQPRGVALTRLGNRKYRDIFDRRLDPRGHTYFWLGGDALEVDNEPDTDVWAVQHGQVSVTPLRLELTHQALLQELAGWPLERLLDGV